MTEGRIIKGIGGFYYVDTNNGIIECRARGVFRKNKITPLIGDLVLIRITKENEKIGYIEEIINRKNEIKRPPVANIQQLIIVVSMKNPGPDFLFVDKLIVASEKNNIKPIMCFNKIDLIDHTKLQEYKKAYVNTGYDIIETSKYNKESIDELKHLLKNKTSAFAGYSGVGKSSLLNLIQPNLKLKTGDISTKLKRGKHTTRHVEIMKLDFGGFVLDTPGFSSHSINDVEYDQLYNYFIDINKYSDMCKFRSCIHYKEPDCSVKDALEEGLISKSRYENYIKLLIELKNGGRK